MTPKTNAEPQISIVVPFYGVEDYVEECLESIKAQTFTDFEVICVDDGSPDGSRAIADRFAAEDSRFRVVEQANGGLSAARNHGTELASAPYIMWVDSDDLLAPRALEQLHDSLEATGSDFAAGHVWRLTPDGVLELSRAHMGTFAETMPATNITELPLLMRDRMVWNKLWRRSFWDEHGYSWPLMRFEDHPVTLRAHLDATSVDVLAVPMYVWRDRPSGTSISQGGKEVGNVRDRVEATMMVLDTVDELGTHELRELVHSYVVDADLLEVMTSVLSADEADRPAVVELGQRLAGRLDPELIGLANPIWVRGYEALLAGRVETVRNIARWRLGERSPATYLAAGRTPAPIKRRTDAVVRRIRNQSVLSPRKRHARLMDRYITDQMFHYRLTMNMSSTLARLARATVRIGDLEVASRTTTVPKGIQIEVSVDPADLLEVVEPTPMEISVRVGPQLWAGKVIMCPDELHGVQRAGRWILAQSQDRTLALVSVTHAHVVDRATVVNLGPDARIRLHFASGRADALTVLNSWPADPLTVPIVDEHAEIPIKDLLGQPGDDPVLHMSQRRLVIRRPCISEPTGWIEQPVVLIGSGTGWRWGEDLVELVRDGAGEARLKIGRSKDAHGITLPSAPQMPGGHDDAAIAATDIRDEVEPLDELDQDEELASDEQALREQAEDTPEAADHADGIEDAIRHADELHHGEAGQ